MRAFDVEIGRPLVSSWVSMRSGVRVLVAGRTRTIAMTEP